MQKAIWHTLIDFWQDCSVGAAEARARQERRQLERSIREHGTLWLTGTHYVPKPLPIQHRLTATR
jgi:hypothetical protein